MSPILSIVCLLLCVGAIFALLRGQKNARRTTVGSPHILEYRTDLPLDACIDLLRQAAEQDLFIYTFARQTDGSFALHFTMHRATQQPIDTLYTLRFESGRQTIISLVFIREAFGYQEPVFPLALLDTFFAEKLSAQRNA
ncbi:MAG: hypothetical protein R3Y06_04175 [Faecalibacterium sp.]